MCYIIFIKCKINQHINIHVIQFVFIAHLQWVLPVGFFFIVSTTQKQTGGNLTWVFSLTEIQRSASWSASSVKNSISSSCRSLMSKCSSPSSLSEIAAISTHTHTQIFKQWSSCRLTRQEKNSGQLNTLQCAPSKLGCLWTYATERSKQALLFMQQKGE